MKVRICEINVNSRLREAMPEKVQELADSIEAIGLLNPITVDQEYTLIAGLHRLEAAKRLGWLEVECNVCDLAGIRAELAEIDENVVRSGLATLDQNELLLRRKGLYESLYPETRHGMRNGQTSKACKLHTLEQRSFVQDTAEKLGVDPSTIRRQVQTAKNMTPEAKQIIRDSGIDITKSAALKLSRLPPEQQEEAARQLVSGTKDKSKPPGPPMPATPPVEPPPPENAGTEEPTRDSSRPPFDLPVRHFDSFAESVAFLKDPDKDCTCTPDIFLADITEFVKKIQREIEWYNDPFYAPAFSGLTGEQLSYLRRQINSIAAAWDEFYDQVERKCKCEQQI